MTDLAAAILRDVRRCDPNWNRAMMDDANDGDWVTYGEVLATLTAAMDPAIADRAGEVLERLRWHREHPVTGKLVYANEDGPDAADLITALLTANAVLRAERDEARENSDSNFRTAKRYLDRIVAAEAVAEKLRGALQAFKDFDDLPVFAKRPDVFELRVRQPILAALSTTEAGE